MAKHQQGQYAPVAPGKGGDEMGIWLYDKIFVAARDDLSLGVIGEVKQIGGDSQALKVIKSGNYITYAEPWADNAGLNLPVEVWVQPAYSGYRGVWEKATGIELDKDTDVDHIYGKARAIDQTYRYVRLALLPFTYNRSWGRWHTITGKMETRVSTGRVLPDLRPIDDMELEKLRAEITWREYYGSLRP